MSKCTPQLTDQEAAADEAIERLCLRCHNLETRLAEAQSSLANGGGCAESGAETPTPSDGGGGGGGGRGRLSPVLEQGEDTEDTDGVEEAAGQRPQKSASIEQQQQQSNDLNTKYSALMTMYEGALQRSVFNPGQLQ